MSTTETFTEAARAEAERTFPPPSDRARPAIAERMTEKRIGFEAGAEWARTHLTTQEESVADDLRAEGWDEGRVAGWDDARDEWLSSGVVNDLHQWSDTPNPYRHYPATEGER